jgi:DegV family protein with EDD domain
MVRLAEQALQMAEANQSAADIAKQLVRLSQATHTLFVPETLEYLHKGGRIGSAAALLGTILQIRPVLYLNSGKVAILDKVRTWSKAVARIVEEVKQHNNPVHIDIVHIEGLVEAQKLFLQLNELYPDVPVSISSGGAVLAAHLGPGLVGVVLQDAI